MCIKIFFHCFKPRPYKKKCFIHQLGCIKNLIIKYQLVSVLPYGPCEGYPPAAPSHIFWSCSVPYSMLHKMIFGFFGESTHWLNPWKWLPPQGEDLAAVEEEVCCVLVGVIAKRAHWVVLHHCWSQLFNLASVFSHSALHGIHQLYFYSNRFYYVQMHFCWLMRFKLLTTRESNCIHIL